MFVWLNSFVMRVVSLPVYVNGAQDRAVGFFWVWRKLRGGFWEELLCRMLWMISSCWYSAGCSWQVFRRLYRNLTAAYLCCVGWFEVYGIMLSVKVGFL
jgi:hypothetical protein